MAKSKVKMVLDISTLLEAIKELEVLPDSLDDGPRNIYSDFLSTFLHIPSDFTVCTKEFTTSGAGDEIVRFSVVAPKFEILAAALAALVAGLKLIHVAPPASD